MTAAELLACDVVDPSGDVVGQVHDITLALRDGESTPTYEIKYLMFAAGTMGSRLGYGYGEMHGPWLLSSLFRWFARNHSRAVEWDHVSDISNGRVHIDVAADSLPSTLDITEGRK